MRVGIHVPIAGGLLESVACAKRLSCSTMQIFSRSPRGGAALPITRAAARRFDAERRRAGITPLAIHSPYIINLASPERRMWSRSVALFRTEYARAAALHAEYLVTHVGSHRGEGPAAGIAQIVRALNATLNSRTPTVMILLENTAGAGQGLGDQFEQLAAIRQAVRRREHVGICLDTAHLFAAGHPIHTAQGLEAVVDAFDRAVGLRHLRLIHLNDSKSAFSSRVDRHWHLGQGRIGRAALSRLVTHPRLRDLPFILETPKEHEGQDRRNLAAARRLAGPRARRRVMPGAGV